MSFSIVVTWCCWMQAAGLAAGTAMVPAQVQFADCKVVECAFIRTNMGLKDVAW